MTFRLAIRSLVSRPVRTAVLACGFGFGIGVMADLLGVGQVIVKQARSPALRGGGDVVVSGSSGEVTSARFVLSNVLGGADLADRSEAVSPSVSTRLYLVDDDGIVPVDARGGVPSLEKAIGDPETAALTGWLDSESDAAWVSPDPAEVLRGMDRFHPIPDVPGRARSWAEWLYFNGSAGNARFYLSFMVGPHSGDGRRLAGVRLQLERAGRMTTFHESAEIDENDLLAHAPHIRIGRNEVRLEGLTYHATLDLGGADDGDTRGDGTRSVVGEITLEATPGRSIPPVTVRGAGGWVSGYAVPVLAGPIGGALRVGSETIDLEGGTGYHDHNWGFWEGVTWHWGQVAHDDLSFVWGRILPPADAADPERVPGFLGVMGAEGPLGFSTNVTIVEEHTPGETGPRSIRVRGRGGSVDLEMHLEVESVIPNRIGGPVWAGREDLDFLQMRTVYHVEGRIGTRPVEFTAPGAAETFVRRAMGPID